jgi:hypothetical protein
MSNKMGFGELHIVDHDHVEHSIDFIHIVNGEIKHEIYPIRGDLFRID